MATLTGGVWHPRLAGNTTMRHSASPTSLRDKLLQGKVLIRNWHALNWETAERIAGRRSVDKRGAKSDEAYVRDVLAQV